MHFLARIDFERCGKHVSSTILLTSDAEHRLNQRCAILLASNAWSRTKSLAPVRINICELIFTNVATEGMRSMLINERSTGERSKIQLGRRFHGAYVHSPVGVADLSQGKQDHNSRASRTWRLPELFMSIEVQRQLSRRLFHSVRQHRHTFVINLRESAGMTANHSRKL